MKNIKKTAKKLIPAAVAGALLLASVWGVLYGAMLAAVKLVFWIALLA